MGTPNTGIHILLLLEILDCAKPIILLNFVALAPAQAFVQLGSPIQVSIILW
jgi:hypothetical protein